MFTIKNVSVQAFCVALRWAKMQGFPNNIKDWTPEQNQRLQEICKEIDRRKTCRHIKRAWYDDHLGTLPEAR